MRKLLCSVLAAVMSVGSFVSLPTAGVGVAAGAAAVMVVATPAPAAAAEMSEMLRYACIYYFNGRIEYLGMANDFAEASPEVATITGGWNQVTQVWLQNLYTWYPNMNELSTEQQQGAIQYTWGETFYNSACQIST